MILALLDEALSAGARLEKACAILGLAARTVTRWREDGGGIDRRAEAGVSPVHKLTAGERDRIVKVATSAEYRDLSPRQIVPLLADKGIYVASESSFYRVLHEHELMAHWCGRSRRLAEPPVGVCRPSSLDACSGPAEASRRWPT
ncbi:MAG: helix-turn-helix domain-containing protein [Labilithrix sp.]|nr:helix-turn-helix domain-containing protein [Labilithrix sp.]